jgi:alpha-glucosidase (family GH31 glycosyl hydrolase)
MLAAVVTLLGVIPHGNRVELKLDRGSGEMLWASPSAFRFRRSLGDEALRATAEKEHEAVALEVEETSGVVKVRSKFVEVSIQKSGVLVRVRKADGAPLMTDLTEARSEAEGVSWDREMRSGARYYGMGPRDDGSFDLRGKKVSPTAPLLYSTLGYGEYFPGNGKYRFDFTNMERYRIEAPAIDYWFYYGPAIKQVFEEHNQIRGTAALWPAETERAGTWATLRTGLLRIVQGGVSGAIAPTFDLGAYANAPAELQQRARQLGSLVSEVSPGKLGVSEFRDQLSTFFDVYAYEAHEKGYPVWHPLPFQFPDDPECALHADEFMLGDEMLVAPIVAAGGSRALYLPQGVWTNLGTNEVFPGRRTITVATASLPVFARNGTIVPLNSEGGMALHYFPKLGAEFFLVEEDGWSQAHAAPAADVLRLQIESKKTRDYQWVVHHVDRPVSVGFEDVQFREAKGALADRTWSYDAKTRNLQVRARVAAGEDSIVNVTFE